MVAKACARITSSLTRKERAIEFWVASLPPTNLDLVLLAMEDVVEVQEQCAEMSERICRIRHQELIPAARPHLGLKARRQGLSPPRQQISKPEPTVMAVRMKPT